MGHYPNVQHRTLTAIEVLLPQRRIGTKEGESTSVGFSLAQYLGRPVTALGRIVNGTYRRGMQTTYDITGAEKALVASTGYIMSPRRFEECFGLDIGESFEGRTNKYPSAPYS
ncbi:hypothetical protein PV10_03713 [Exophiala mesophila]|uniref:Uncharacterized protein n=1 Tax=Exophiala mesophila TaxID=212818 RepID=A0A0D2A040_EXOME|nr:uncharacterized protein PV10_03713 [Exophiala mesophila]KIV92413.1 hypothetical protein PV10_03713 [Exophiala mesophila]